MQWDSDPSRITISTQPTLKLPSVQSSHNAKTSTNTTDGIGTEPAASWRTVLDSWSLPIYVILFLLIYAPCVITQYASADDYSYVSSYLFGSKGLFSNRTFWDITSDGRPIYALMVQASIGIQPDFGSLRLVRTAGIIGIGLLAWLVYRTLRAAKLDAHLAFCIPVVICTLPPLQLFAAWATTSYFAFGCVLGGLAAITLEHLWVTKQVGWRRLSIVVAAVALQTIATAIYQPAAMTFWVFAAVYLLVRQNTVRDLPLRFALQLAVVVAGLALDYVFMKLLPLIHATAVPAADTGFTTHPLEKAQLFIHIQMADALNLWSLEPSHVRAAIIAFLIIGGLLLFFKGSWQERIIRLMLAIVLLPLAYLPDLVVAANEYSFRTEVALTALVGLYAALAAFSYVRLIASMLDTLGRSRIALALPQAALVALFGVIACICLAANGTVANDFVTPNYVEYHVLRSQLEQANLGSTSRRVYVRLSCPAQSPAPIVRYEFGLPTTSITWGAAQEMTALELHALYPSPYSSLDWVKILPHDSAETPRAGAVVIDTSRLAYYSPYFTPALISQASC